MKSHTPNEKAKIVLESLSTSTDVAELCRRHNLRTRRRTRGSEGFKNGKAGFSRGGRGDPAAAAKMENGNREDRTRAGPGSRGF